MYIYMQVSKIKSNFTALKNVQANSTSIQQYYFFVCVCLAIFLYVVFFFFCRFFVSIEIYLLLAYLHTILSGSWESMP